MKNNNVIDFQFAPSLNWTNIGLKDDPYKTVVREDGALLYGFKAMSMNSFYFERVYEFGILAAHGSEDIHQVTESAQFPCVVTRLDYSKASLTLRSFAYSKDGRRSDITLWKISLKEGVPDYLTGLTLNIFDRSKNFEARSAAPARVIFAVENQPKVTDGFTEGEDIPLVEDESLPVPGEVAFLSEPVRLVPTHPTGFRPCSAFGNEPTVLHMGETLSGAIIIPLNYQDVRDLDFSWAERAYLEAKNEWEQSSLLSLPIHVPDAGVMDMLTACARNILQAREIQDGLPVFQVGPTIYRGLWVVDGHFMLEAAQYLGYRADAFRGVDTLLKRVDPDGSISIFKFHTKETGISLATLIRQCELMGDYQRLRELWPIIQNGVAFIEKLRMEAYSLPDDSPCYKLLPMSFGDGGLGGLRGEYTTVFWVLAGLRSVATAARRLGFVDDAKRFQSDYENLLADFRIAALRDMQLLADGTPYLPMCMPGSSDHVWNPNYPGQIPEYQKLTPASATWAFCHAIYPGEVFRPDDPLVLNLLHLYDLVDDQEGIPAYTGWAPYNALWCYNASFAAHAWLYANRGDKALEYLYAFANHASPTRVWREEQSLTASDEGQWWGEMPHNWASAEFIRLVRHLVVFERGDELELLAGVPANWRKPGDVIIFDRTPTRFGPVSLHLETQTDGRFILNVELDAESTIKPETLRAKLQGLALRANGLSLEPDLAGWARLPVEAKIHIEGIWVD